MTTLLPADTLTVRLWRHHDPDTIHLPGVDLGTEAVTGDPADAADELVARGAGRVALVDPIDPIDPAGRDPAATVRALALVRELTSRAVAVTWRVAAHPDWRLLNHLYPPTEVVGPQGEEIRREWESGFFLCRFVYRHGPGFVQVRDRRTGDLSRITIDDPAYLAAIDTLHAGAPVSAVAEEILADLTAEGMAGVLGDLAWWIPYRVRHWPWPVMIL